MQFKQITPTCPNGYFLGIPTLDCRENVTYMLRYTLKNAI